MIGVGAGGEDGGFEEAEGEGGGELEDVGPGLGGFVELYGISSCFLYARGSSAVLNDLR